MTVPLHTLQVAHLSFDEEGRVRIALTVGELEIKQFALTLLGSFEIKNRLVTALSELYAVEVDRIDPNDPAMTAIAKTMTQQVVRVAQRQIEELKEEIRVDQAYQLSMSHLYGRYVWIVLSLFINLVQGRGVASRQAAIEALEDRAQSYRTGPWGTRRGGSLDSATVPQTPLLRRQLLIG